MKNTPPIARVGSSEMVRPFSMNPEIKVGDDVQWMESKSYRSGGMSFSTKYGTVLEIGHKVAKVKRRGGKSDFIALRRLVARNQPSPVNHVFGALTASV